MFRAIWTFSKWDLWSSLWGSGVKPQCPVLTSLTDRRPPPDTVVPWWHFSTRDLIHFLPKPRVLLSAGERRVHCINWSLKLYILFFTLEILGHKTLILPLLPPLCSEWKSDTTRVSEIRTRSNPSSSFWWLCDTDNVCWLWGLPFHRPLT